MVISSWNIQVDNVVILQDENLIPTKWPLAKVLQVYPGKDGIVCVTTVALESTRDPSQSSHYCSLKTLNNSEHWTLKTAGHAWPAVVGVHVCFLLRC